MESVIQVGQLEDDVPAWDLAQPGIAATADAPGQGEDDAYGDDAYYADQYDGR